MDQIKGNLHIIADVDDLFQGGGGHERQEGGELAHATVQGSLLRETLMEASCV